MTVATLFLVALGVGGFLVYQILIANWRLSPENWIDIAQRTAVPTTRHILAEERDNSGMITLWLSYVATPSSYFNLLRTGELEVILRTTSDATAFLFDADGVLIGSSDNERFAPVTGRSFEPSAYPAIAPSVVAALGGKTDAELLVRPANGASDSFAVAVPITAEQDGSGEFLGVLAVHFERLAGRSEVIAYTARFAGFALMIIAVLTTAVALLFAFLTAKPMTSRIARMSRIAGRWSTGDFSQFVEDPATDEIGALSKRFDSMAMEMNRLLGEREQIAISQERNRFARDLHDSVKQQALAASFQIGTALSVIGSDVPAAVGHLQEADKLLDDLRQELASLISEVFGSMPGTADAESVLQRFASDWAARTGIHATVDISDLGELDSNIWHGLFRIIQEALSNIARHSEATRIMLKLRHHAEQTDLEIADNGSGFLVDKPTSGIGLHSMRERCRELGGQFLIESRPREGTRIRVTIREGSRV